MGAADAAAHPAASRVGLCEGASPMRRIALAVLLILPALAACASRQGAASAKAVDAVAQDEGQRQKVLGAIHAGDTPTQAMAKVADGPKAAQPTAAAPAPK
jgi:F0F1-type ATP synthase membrane subunit c/vacuolar-type H+-ATPase subunit K